MGDDCMQSQGLKQYFIFLFFLKPAQLSFPVSLSSAEVVGQVLSYTPCIHQQLTARLVFVC